jgi:hypothetical protein
VESWSPPGIPLRAWAWRDYVRVAGAFVYHGLAFLLVQGTPLEEQA